MLAEEVTGTDKRSHAAQLRQFITQESIRINVKNIPSYAVRDCLNWLLTSNAPDAMFMNDLDRRYFVHEVTAQPLPDAWFDDYFAWLDGAGAAALFYYLLHLDLSGFNPKAPAMKTAAKARMIADSKSDLGAWVAALKDDPDGVLRLGDVPIPGDLFTAAELHDIYDPMRQTRASAAGLARELRRAGFAMAAGGSPIRGSDGRLGRYYAVRNPAKWVKVKDAEKYVGEIK